MTLKAALESGKPFKRKINEEWIHYDPIKYNGWFYGFEDGIEWGSTSLDLYYECLIAEDWEIDSQ